MSGTYLVKYSIFPSASALNGNDINATNYMDYASPTPPPYPEDGKTVWVDTSTVPTGVPKLYKTGKWVTCAVVIPPLTQNRDTSLTFVGYRAPVYGEALWTNMLHLLEHFASPLPPTNPMVGQIWVDTSATLSTGGYSPGVPKVYNTQNVPGSQGYWSVIAAGLTVGAIPPVVTLPVDPLYPPDLWFNPANNSLQYYNTTTSPPTWTGITCIAYASQIEYNALITSVKAIAPQVGRTVSIPLIDTTAGSSNYPPTPTQWGVLLAEIQAIAAVVRDYYTDPKYGLDPTYWNSVIDSLTAAIGTEESFTWCPAGESGKHGIATYSALFDVMQSVFSNVTAWYNAPDPLGAARFHASSLTVTPTNNTITFTNQSVNTTSSLWTFGDGTLASPADPSVPVVHTFPKPGVYPVKLTVKTPKGTDSTTQLITSYIVPVASLKATAPTTGIPPLNVTFLDESTNSPTSWLWTVTEIFDEAGNPVNNVVAVATTQNFQFLYTTSGTYQVSLVSSNVAGSSATPAVATVITANTPIASFTRSPTAPVVAPPLTVQFTDTSVNDPTTWLWDFGDGGTSTVQNPSHTYTSSNLFTVKLTASNVSGTTTTTVPNCVATSIPPIANFSYTNPTGSAPLTIQFTDASTNLPASWLWDFGDGNTSTQQNPSYTYTANGVFTVALTATNAAGTNTKMMSNLVNTQFNFNIAISTDQTNYNLAAALTAAGWNGQSPVVGTVQINTDIVISSNSTAIPAFRTGVTFPTGSHVTIINYGYIVGMGGAGGNGSKGVNASIAWATAGLSGGPALQFDGNTSSKIKLMNLKVIAGGGGGGGGAVSYRQTQGPSGGGGRTGRTNSATGANGWGNVGTFASAGGAVAPGGNGNSGAGGNWGAAGGAGSDWPGDTPLGNGGAGGPAVVNSSGFSLPLGNWGTYYGTIA